MVFTFGGVRTHIQDPTQRIRPPSGAKGPLPGRDRDLALATRLPHRVKRSNSGVNPL